MRTEEEVQRFYEDQIDQFPEAQAVYYTACYEGCIPRQFWSVSSDQVRFNKDVFRGPILNYCRKWRRARRHGYGLILTGSNGGGKRQPLTTPILTPTGWRTIGDLKVGDFVIGSDGKPCRVTKLHPIVNVPVYKLTFSDGRTSTSCAGHLWTFDVLRRSGHGKKPIFERKTATLEEWRDEELLTKNGWRRLWLPMLSGPVVFKKQSSLPLDPYTLGVLLGDGHFGSAGPSSPVVTIGNLDLDILDLVSWPDGVIEKRCRGVGCEVVRLVGGGIGRASKNELITILRNLGLWELKGRQKFVPEIYLRSPPEDRLRLLQGLMDTDGSACKLTHHFSTMSKKLAFAVRELTESLAGVSRISRKSRDGEWCVSVKLPRGISAFRCSRKSKLASEYIPRTEWSYEPSRALVSIQDFGNRRDCRCITVDREDGLYAVEGCILTHNTFFSCFVLTQMIKRECSVYYTTSMQLDIDLKRGFRDAVWEKRLDSMLESDFLVIDELGKEKGKDDGYFRARLELLLKSRCDNGDPTIIVTNLDDEAIVDMYGDSVQSIFNGKYETVMLKHGDYRRAIAVRRQKTMGTKK